MDLGNRVEGRLRRSVGKGVCLVTLAVAGMVASPLVTSAQADTRPPCGGHVIGDKYYYTNCNYNAVRVKFDVRAGADYKDCYHGKAYRQYVGWAHEIRSATVDKVYVGPTYWHSCPYDA